jgi:hypothetical protein
MYVLLEECRNKTGSFTPVNVSQSMETKIINYLFPFTPNDTATVRRRSSVASASSATPMLFPPPCSEGQKSRLINVRIVILFIVLGLFGMAQGMAG